MIGKRRKTHATKRCGYLVQRLNTMHGIHRLKNVVKGSFTHVHARTSVMNSEAPAKINMLPCELMWPICMSGINHTTRTRLHSASVMCYTNAINTEEKLH